jgi:hypothetical protein
MARLSKIELNRLQVTETIRQLYDGEILDELVAEYGTGLWINVEVSSSYYDEYEAALTLMRSRLETDEEYNLRLERAKVDIVKLRKREEKAKEKRAATDLKRKEAAVEKRRAMYEELKAEFDKTGEG